MKITKQRLRQIIKEELEFVGAEIDQVPQPEAEDDSSLIIDLLGTPEGTLLAKIMARKIIDQFASFPELADAIPTINRDEMTAIAVAAIKENPMYAKGMRLGPAGTATGPWPDNDDEMELEERWTTGAGKGPQSSNSGRRPPGTGGESKKARDPAQPLANPASKSRHGGN